MSKKKISQPDQMLLWEDSLVSPLVSQAPDKPKTTPDISGRICLDLSKNYGPIGLLEKTLLVSSTWAWTKYSLTWKTRATPQGRLIFQLARSAHHTNGIDSGSLRTALVGETPNQPDPNKKDLTSEMWPTPRASGQENPESLIKRKGEKAAAKHNLTAAVKMYPTPTTRDWKDTGNLQNTQQRKDGRIRNDSLPRVIAQQIFPTPNAWDGKRGPQSMETLRDGNHQVNLIDAVTHDKTKPSPKDSGSLNPKWVAWLMGYPTEYLSSVPWETRSSRKSSKKSD
jgi:hypothetical protein